MGRREKGWDEACLEVEHARGGGLGEVLADGDLVESCIRGKEQVFS